VLPVVEAPTAPWWKGPETPSSSPTKQASRAVVEACISVLIGAAAISGASQGLVDQHRGWPPPGTPPSTEGQSDGICLPQSVPSIDRPADGPRPVGPRADAARAVTLRAARAARSRPPVRFGHHHGYDPAPLFRPPAKCFESAISARVENLQVSPKGPGPILSVQPARHNWPERRAFRRELERTRPGVRLPWRGRPARPRARRPAQPLDAVDPLETATNNFIHGLAAFQHFDSPRPGENWWRENPIAGWGWFYQPISWLPTSCSWA